jgi:hypothetical protein
MLIGAHSILYSTRPEADRAFLREVLELPHVDVGEGWLIFGLPPAEVAVHPSEKNDVHEFFLMCDDVDAFAERMREHATPCTAVQELGWGRLVRITLPGGGELGIYEPRHARPESMPVAGAREPTRRAAETARAPKAATKRKDGGKGSGRAR